MQSTEYLAVNTSTWKLDTAEQHATGSTEDRGPLRLLLIDDAEDDALLIVDWLRRTGYDVVWQRVASPSTLIAALGRAPWELILCDWCMPGFGALPALSLLRERGVSAPVIVVSGSAPERMVKAALSAGAYDVVGKDELTRLLPAIERVRREGEVERWHRNAEATLESINRELESFAYTVSHDLRGPVRNIQVFVGALLNDHAKRMDANGKSLLLRIRTTAKRMAELIEDLLTLSLASQMQEGTSLVDLGGLARQIADELRRNQPRRSVDFVIAPHLVVRGEERLLRIAMENLVGNAWKYTSRHSHACIEVGAVDHDAQPTYFVRDDGVGFDPGNAQELFTPFKRLHTDFPGTGIGLTTVKRIIDRHGGRIWATAQVEQGATFYFTLPAATP